MQHTWDVRYLTAYNSRYGQYKFEQQYPFIVSEFKNRSNILDIAGGSGRFALPLYNLCKDITVVDIHKDALDIIKGKNPAINVVTGDFTHVELADKYSLILCIEALSHFTDYQMVFNKISSLLADDGNFVFTIVNPNSWRFKLRRFNTSRTELNEIDYERVEQLLHENNLKITNVKGFNWVPIPLTMSNSILVNFFSAIERSFRLDKLISQSPWLLISASKQ